MTTIPDTYTIVRFTSHRARNNYDRYTATATDGPPIQMYNINFTGEQITAIPAATLDRLLTQGGNAMKGVQTFKRQPDLNDYRRCVRI